MSLTGESAELRKALAAAEECSSVQGRAEGDDNEEEDGSLSCWNSQRQAMCKALEGLQAEVEALRTTRGTAGNHYALMGAVGNGGKTRRWTALPAAPAAKNARNETDNELEHDAAPSSRLVEEADEHRATLRAQHLHALEAECDGLRTLTASHEAEMRASNAAFDAELSRALAERNDFESRMQRAEAERERREAQVQAELRAEQAERGFVEAEKARGEAAAALVPDFLPQR